MPARLRYQACDETTCFRPMTVPLTWTFVVGRKNQIDAGIRAARRNAADSRAVGCCGSGASAVANRRPRGVAATGLDRSVAAARRVHHPRHGGGYLNKDEFLKFIRNAERGVKRRACSRARGPLAILLLVFLGGLALNLTPCVLPMIPINLAIIGAGAQAGSRGRGFLLGCGLRRAPWRSSTACSA